MSRALINLHNMLPQKVRHSISRILYECLSQMDREANILFMNYGWADLDPETKQIPLSLEDDLNRYCIQLYHHVTSTFDLRGMDVLEIGCGRGGGASYIMRYLNPRSLVGVDISASAIRFCNRHYDIAGLSFVQDKAESLQFDENSVDVIISIESSHCYVSMEQFLNGVYSVLRPGGYFLFADLRLKEQMVTLHQQLRNSGLVLLKEERISRNVVRALDLVNARKEELIKWMIPRLLQSLFSEFAGMKGTHAYYGKLKTGDMEYLSFVFRK